jgi:hypothetical protein
MAGLALVPVTARAQLSALHARRSRATDARAAWMRVRASIKENILRAFVVHLTQPDWVGLWYRSLEGGGCGKLYRQIHDRPSWCILNRLSV